MRRIELILDPPTADIGAEYTGKVVNITKFGAFVNILPGRDGLLHISKIGRGKRIDKVEDVFSLGDEVVVRVDDIDNQGKLSLSLAGDAPEGEGGGDDGGGRERGSRDDRGDRGGRDRRPRRPARSVPTPPRSRRSRPTGTSRPRPSSVTSAPPRPAVAPTAVVTAAASAAAAVVAVAEAGAGSTASRGHVPVRPPVALPARDGNGSRGPRSASIGLT